VPILGIQFTKPSEIIDHIFAIMRVNGGFSPCSVLLFAKGPSLPNNRSYQNKPSEVL
jgi:hypothetical protein